MTLVFGQNQRTLKCSLFQYSENLESQFMEFNKQINQELENAGYGKDFIKFTK